MPDFFNLDDDAAELAALVADAQPEIDQILFPHVCDLWAIGLPKQDSKKRTMDAQYELVARGQVCQILPTIEVDEPGMMGRYRNDNSETLDGFWFPSGVAVTDGMVIIVRSPGDNEGQIWTAQGNPKSLTPDILRPVSYQLVLAANTPIVPGGLIL